MGFSLEGPKLETFGPKCQPYLQPARMMANSRACPSSVQARPSTSIDNPRDHPSPKTRSKTKGVCSGGRRRSGWFQAGGWWLTVAGAGRSPGLHPRVSQWTRCEGAPPPPPNECETRPPSTVGLAPASRQLAGGRRPVEVDWRQGFVHPRNVAAARHRLGGRKDPGAGPSKVIKRKVNVQKDRVEGFGAVGPDLPRPEGSTTRRVDAANWPLHVK